MVGVSPSLQGWGARAELGMWMMAWEGVVLGEGTQTQRGCRKAPGAQNGSSRLERAREPGGPAVPLKGLKKGRNLASGLLTAGLSAESGRGPGRHERMPRCGLTGEGGCAHLGLSFPSLPSHRIPFLGVRLLGLRHVQDATLWGGGR